MSDGGDCKTGPATTGLLINKAAVQAAGTDPLDATPPIGKIHPFVKMFIPNIKG